MQLQLSIEFGPLRNTKWATTIKACSFHPKELHQPTAQQKGLGSQSMNSPLLAEETGPRHMGHLRNCWRRWQFRQTTWPQGMRTTAGRCSWQMGQVMQVPLARSGHGSVDLAASATGHVALTWNQEPKSRTPPPWNPSSNNMARNFFSKTPFPTSLLWTSLLRYIRNTLMQQLFF